MGFVECNLFCDGAVRYRPRAITLYGAYSSQAMQVRRLGSRFDFVGGSFYERLCLIILDGSIGAAWGNYSLVLFTI